MATRDNLPRPNCDSDGPTENKRQRTVVWLIHHQSECQEEVIFVILQRTSLVSEPQWILLSARRVTLHLRNPAQFLGDVRTSLSVR